MSYSSGTGAGVASAIRVDIFASTGSAANSYYNYTVEVWDGAYLAYGNSSVIGQILSGKTSIQARHSQSILE